MNISTLEYVCGTVPTSIHSRTEYSKSTNYLFTLCILFVRDRVTKDQCVCLNFELLGQCMEYSSLLKNIVGVYLLYNVMICTKLLMMISVD